MFISPIKLKARAAAAGNSPASKSPALGGAAAALAAELEDLNLGDASVLDAASLTEHGGSSVPSVGVSDSSKQPVGRVVAIIDASGSASLRYEEEGNEQ
jgi:hypothetical protein